jgi:hypothetical protein
MRTPPNSKVALPMPKLTGTKRSAAHRTPRSRPTTSAVSRKEKPWKVPQTAMATTATATTQAMYARTAADVSRVALADGDNYPRENCLGPYLHPAHCSAKDIQGLHVQVAAPGTPPVTRVRVLAALVRQFYAVRRCRWLPPSLHSYSKTSVVTIPYASTSVHPLMRTATTSCRVFCTIRGADTARFVNESPIRSRKTQVTFDVRPLLARGRRASGRPDLGVWKTPRLGYTALEGSPFSALGTRSP